MAEIKIDIDTEKKGIKNFTIPDELNPAEVVIIFNNISNILLNGIKMEKAGNIEVVKPKIIQGVK